MNSLRTLIFCSLALFGFAPAFLASVHGQHVPPPGKPMLPRAPERSEWVVRILPDRQAANQALLADKPSPPESPAATREIRISKAGNLYREIITEPAGRRLEKWVFPDLQILLGPEGNPIPIHSGTGYLNSNASDYRTSDFEELEWVEAGLYKGTRKFRGRTVHVFEAPGGVLPLTPRETADLAAGRLSPSETRRGRDGVVAFLDVRTQLPVYFDDGEVVRTYEFVPPVQPTLSPPEEVTAVLREEIAYQRKKNARPLPP